MITLVYGGSGSGKSAFAEDLVCATDYKKRYYLATMHSNDEESRKRIIRHRQLREGKGFITIEQYCNIVNALNTMKHIDAGNFSTLDNENSTIMLLECMSNLVANEMFRDGRVYSADECVDKILKDVRALADKLSSLVIVSNNIFEDGVAYDSGTKEYMRALGKINRELAKISDSIYEVVVGIGIKL